MRKLKFNDIQEHSYYNENIIIDEDYNRNYNKIIFSLLENHNVVQYINSTYQLFDNLKFRTLLITDKCGRQTLRFLPTGNNEIGNNDIDFLLPLGSAITISDEKLIIVGRKLYNEDKLYDYVGITIPYGVVDNNHQFFNSCEIDEVNSIGLQCVENDIFNTLYLEEEKKNGKT